ncbi:hypothetical protein CAPTEDRAFT_189943 [Capitella teleta]|uniref:Uncharacterized protein n=1 Tax=Capitella teleta TaxID=283909 RepID=R7VDX8_CAPTE|nr:hypothetical protein CAPTEDRAFT_189943 [Capitella teleta]|eukprot:ELU17048.1 hypothetical protein CAPTEDRAFT_189943 [Capitella teleta]
MADADSLHEAISDVDQDPNAADADVEDDECPANSAMYRSSRVIYPGTQPTFTRSFTQSINVNASSPRVAEQFLRYGLRSYVNARMYIVKLLPTCYTRIRGRGKLQLKTFKKWEEEPEISARMVAIISEIRRDNDTDMVVKI